LKKLLILMPLSAVLILACPVLANAKKHHHKKAHHHAKAAKADSTIKQVAPIKFWGLPPSCQSGSSHHDSAIFQNSALPYSSAWRVLWGRVQSQEQRVNAQCSFFIFCL